MRYPAKFESVPEGGFLVTFRDIPEAITQGENFPEAVDMATDALRTAMEFYFEDRRPVPPPSNIAPDEKWVELPPGISTKILLLNEMLAQHVTASELARRLGIRPQDVQRLTDLHHATKIDTLADALHKLGKRLEISIIPD